MKIVAFVAVMMALTMTVHADKSLGDAMIELRQALGLHNWVAYWDVLRVSDREVCEFSNALNADYPAAFAKILSDPVYGDLTARMARNNVPWDEFVAGELQPALGYHAIVSCPAGSSGGVVALRGYLYDSFSQALVDSTIARLRTESAEFNDMHMAIEANQAAVKNLRCSAEVQRVFNTMDAQSVDFDFIVGVVSSIFGWDPATAC